MLKLDVARLLREGSLRVDAEVPASDPLWTDSLLTFDGPAVVDMTAQAVAGGEIVVRGMVRGTLARECRRCLEPVRTELDEELTLVWAPRDELAPGEEDEGEVRPLDVEAGGIDLGRAIREELILSVDPWVECSPDCEGLCPQCGVNLNRESCDCTLEEPDPRWDALRALNEDE